jgi:hypothetical protein
LDFDVKLRGLLDFNDPMGLTFLITDSMAGVFIKNLTGIAHELVKFVSSSVSGNEYDMPAEDDTNNIANPMNYLPKKSDFKHGGGVFTDPEWWKPGKTSDDLGRYYWEFPLA